MSFEDSEAISYTINDILINFSNKDYSRGESYANQWRVTNLKLSNDGHLTANVRGSKRPPYKVAIQITENRGNRLFYGSCSYPLGEGCKHIVATFYCKELNNSLIALLLLASSIMV